VEDSRGLCYDLAEALDGFLVALQSSEEHSSVVVVGHYLDRLGALLYLSHWLLDDLQRVLVAFGLETEFRKVAVEAGNLLAR
jgi:hypothetical protein